MLINRTSDTNTNEEATRPRRTGRAVGIAAAVALSLGSIGAMAAPASASTRLGGVSVTGACNNQWPGYWKVALIANNVNGWKCQFNSSSGPVYFGVNLTQQCRQQYNNSSAFASYSNFNDPYSWSCYV